MSKNGKIKVAILGSTGMVGQVFVWLLSNHKEFEIVELCASPRKDGLLYEEAVKWNLPVELDSEVKKIKVNSIDPTRFHKKGLKIIFSGLPSDVAQGVEGDLRNQGFFIFSNASAFRYEQDVPIIIPEANINDLALVKKQVQKYGGAIVTNANCSATGIVAAIAPLRKFILRELFVSTYQSISGAGYPGLPSMDILGNVIPFIKNEEEKIPKELVKILDCKFNVYPFCVRVPVLYGHLETVWIKFAHKVPLESIKEAWNSFRIPQKTPHIPNKPILYREDPDFPQSKHSFTGTPPGMQTFVGRLKEEKEYIGFVLMANNIVKGGAGGSVQNAEIFKELYGGELL